MEKKHNITFKYVKKIEESELDIINIEAICGKKAFESVIDKIYDHLNEENGWEGESEQINITLLEDVIKRMKKAGATHLEIVPHGDHNGYVFYGVAIRKSTDFEIKSRETKSKTLVELSRKRNSLRNEIEAIDEQIRKL